MSDVYKFTYGQMIKYESGELRYQLSSSAGQNKAEISARHFRTWSFDRRWTCKRPTITFQLYYWDIVYVLMLKITKANGNLAANDWNSTKQGVIASDFFDVSMPVAWFVWNANLLQIAVMICIFVWKYVTIAGILEKFVVDVFGMRLPRFW